MSAALVISTALLVSCGKPNSGVSPAPPTANADNVVNLYISSAVLIARATRA
jgi:hypothetical protein